MEREILLTGVGGQGVQLAAQVMARAATLEGRRALMLGVYLGAMRGGNSDSTVVIGGHDELFTPPIVSAAWAAIALHHEHWPAAASKLRDGGVVMFDADVFAGDVDEHRTTVVPVSATSLATDLGAPQAASMVLCGAFAALTGVVSVDSCVAAMTASLPPYRAQYASANEAAIRAGAAAVPAGDISAWDAAGV